MTGLNTLLLGIEIWGAIFSLLIFVIVQREGLRSTESAVFAAMQVTCFFYIVSDVISWMFEGLLAPFFVTMEYIAVFVFYLCGYLLLALYTIILFLDMDLNRGSRFLKYMAYAMAGLEIGLLFVSQFNHMFYYFDANGYYHRGPAYIYSQIFAVIAMVGNFGFICFHHRDMDKNKRIAMFFYILIPLVCLIIQIKIYGLSFLCIGMFVANIIMFFLSQKTLQKQFIVNQEKMMRQREMLFAKEREIHDMQYRIVMSQIRPHFLYNALNAIYYLIEVDSGKAQTAIADFSEYLRGNMNFIQADQPIPFHEELMHIRHYLSLEKIRYDEDLQIFWDIQEEDFMLPALSVQPIVENAVKHGLGKKEGGGFIRIATDRLDDQIRIRVEDDGVGFNPEEPLEDGRLHIGLENVKTRIRQMVGGSVKIDSEPGKGTRVTILIPVMKESDGEESL